ncbi:polyprotein [Phytophthora megakarya]|uniref:Polyprotein n=1 Tax=Phytophthora megakarya TaxID=4795 RepID=A0A225VUK7_9STRA|nr:polyprotein [Phytophthora megakarya]
MNVLHLITQRVFMEHHTKIRSATSAMQAWNTLLEFYNRTTHTRVTMTRRLHEFKMEDGPTMTRHLDNFDELIVGLLTLGELLDDNRQLNSKNVTLVEAKEKLLKEYERQEKKESPERALKATSFGDRGMSVEFQRNSCVIWYESEVIASGKKYGKAYVLDCHQDTVYNTEFAGVDSELVGEDTAGYHRYAQDSADGENVMWMYEGQADGYALPVTFANDDVTPSGVDSHGCDGPDEDEKSEIVNKFKLFLTMYENQWGERIKCLRPDNGTGFVFKTMDNICQQYGIIHQKTIPYSPQQNGVAERMNRTIMEKARSMLHYKGVSAMCMRSTTTPYELLFKDKPRLNHLRVFGSIGYAHVDKSKRTKLGAKGFKCMFLGFDEDSLLAEAVLAYAAAVGDAVAYIVPQLLRFLKNPGQHYWKAAMRVLRYLKGTRDIAIVYNGDKGKVGLTAYTDADWRSILDDRRSVSGTMMMISGAPVVFKSNYQCTVALSSAEAEYMALSQCTQDVLWTRAMLKDLIHEQVGASQVLEDNQGVVALASNVGENVAREIIDVNYVSQKDQLADMLTKGLAAKRLQYLLDASGVVAKGAQH